MHTILVLQNDFKGGGNIMSTHDQQQENHAKDQKDNKPNHGSRKKKKQK